MDEIEISSGHWFNRHPKLTLSFLVLLGCIVILVLVEISARIFVPQWAPTREERVKFWTYDERLGWAHIPNRRGRFNHRLFSVEVAINSHGMRDDEYSLERTEKNRMLVLGDSYAWGFGVEHEERFSEILESKHPHWEIINASVSGYSTDQQYLFLKEAGLAFKPDVVLLLIYSNDFWGNTRGELYWYFKPFFIVQDRHLKLENAPVPNATAKQRLDRFLLGRTYLGPRLYIAYSRIRAMLGFGSKSSLRSKHEEIESRRREAEVTYLLIASMNEIARMNGARFILVSIPMSKDKRAFLQDAATAENIPYLQLDRYFVSKKHNAYFRGDPHWNALGHEAAAKAIDMFLEREGILNSISK